MSAYSTTWSLKTPTAEGEGVEPSRLIARLFSRQLPSPIGLPFPTQKTEKARCPCDTGPLIALGSLLPPGVSEASCAVMNNSRVDFPAGRRYSNLTAESNWVVGTAWERIFVSLVEHVVDAGLVELVRSGDLLFWQDFGNAPPKRRSRQIPVVHLRAASCIGQGLIHAPRTQGPIGYLKAAVNSHVLSLRRNELRVGWNNETSLHSLRQTQKITLIAVRRSRSACDSRLERRW